MTIDVTTKYISDDGIVFNSEEDCIEWEQAEKVYILMEKCDLVKNILGVFKTKTLAENEKRNCMINNYNHIYVDTYRVKVNAKN